MQAAMIYRAAMETRHFAFAAYGGDELAATTALEAGLRLHGAQCGLSGEWWHGVYSIDVRPLALGTTYRDGEPLA